MASVPKLIAHRGHAARFPENTIAALRSALDVGARYVETDVQLSRDETPHLFHDRTLARLCGADGAIHERTAGELKNLRASERGRFGERFANEPIATLAELVELVRGRRDAHAFVEIKRISLEHFGPSRVAARVLAELEPIVERCSVISFSLEALQEVRRRSPVTIGAVFDDWSQAQAQDALALAPEWIFCDVDGLPATGELRWRDAKLAVYEVADPTVARALFERGVGWVETFEIQAMQAALSAGAR